MIPDNAEELHALAGEYVLGVLDPDEAGEVAAALTTHAELARAVAFWEEQLDPLSGLASPANPPAATWDAIERRIQKPAAQPAPQGTALGFWNNLVMWRWSSAGFAVAAAALALWIAVTPAPGPSFVAVLHPPQQDQASWVATAGAKGLVVLAVAGGVPPADRAFELWAIAPGATRPKSLGIIPPDGELRLSPLPPDLRDGTTLAISVEPPGGSPTQQPTGPVVFVGSVKPV
jgi:anti-sigma-K factor RskA